jgi:small subunit ribosomal protein S4
MIHLKEKKERSLGVKLFLKGERCNSPKCALTRRPYRPGIHGKRRRVVSEYGHQLSEKQKIKFSYGLNERQLRTIFQKALKKPGAIKDFIVKALETRLDSTIFRLGIASSKRIARQMVSHGHILVNGKRVSAPSYKVLVGDVICIRPQSKEMSMFKDLKNSLKNYQVPTWLALDQEKIEGKVLSFPSEVDSAFDINLVVDYYSK